jgi:hypothetical protein
MYDQKLPARLLKSAVVSLRQEPPLAARLLLLLLPATLALWRLRQ